MGKRVLGNVLIVDGDDAATPTEAVKAATEAWAERGADEWDILEANLPTAMRRAWWGNDEVGFVTKEHPEATQVVVFPLPERGEEG